MGAFVDVPHVFDVLVPYESYRYVTVFNSRSFYLPSRPPPPGARQSLQNKFAQPLHLSSNNGPDTTRTGILFHTIGTVVTIWYGLDGWSSEYFLGIFFLFCFVPAVIDALAFMFYSCVHWNTRVRAPEDIKGSLYRCICCSRCRESASDGGETRRGDGSAHMGTRKRPDEATRLLDSESDEEDEDDDDNDGKSSEPDTKEVEGDTGEDTEGDRSEDDEAEEKIRTEGDEEPEEGGSASDVSDVGPLTDDSEDDDDDKRPKRKGRGRSKRRAAV